MRQLALKLFFLIAILTSATSHSTPSPENEVFKLTPQVSDPNTLLLKWTILPKNFLYKNRFSFKTSLHQSLGPVRYPNTDITKVFPDKKYQVYRDEVTIPLSVLSNKAGKFIIRVSHQGCADSGFCYPPTQDRLLVTVNQDLAMVAVKKLAKKPLKSSVPEVKKNATPYDTLFSQHNLFYIIISFLGFGLLLAFTPCVLPMVPVLSGIIVGHHKNITHQKALLLSISYVLGMSLTYAIVGVLIAAIGQNLQTLFQSPITIGIFATLFVLLALSMFDFYDLKLPTAWQSAIAKRSQAQNSGAYLGAFSMGALSTLILSPCVTAPLVGALSYIAESGNMLVGGLALFSLGLGMGIPLIIVGASAGKLLPKAGHWMNHIKHLFGVILLIIAIGLAERVAPPAITMLCWSALLIIIAIFIGLFEKNLVTNQQMTCKGIAIMMFGYGLLILVGVSMGATSPYQPLQPLIQSKGAPVPTQGTIQLAGNNVEALAQPIIVNNLKDAQAIIRQAKKQHKKVLVDFYADWCASCKEMDNKIFADEKVKQALKSLIWLKVDLTNRNSDSASLEKKFNIVAPPTLLFISDTGKELSRIIGETTKEAVIHSIKK